MANITEDTMFYANRMIKQRIARVKHMCHRCRQSIEVGEEYVHCTDRFEDSITQKAYHRDCYFGPTPARSTKKYKYRPKQKAAVSDGVVVELRLRQAPRYYAF